MICVFVHVFDLIQKEIGGSVYLVMEVSCILNNGLCE